ncbi:PilW family protein [Noviherbaspirillum humi]|nr:PilW family protein [Noviherbaspirillum humi]
MGLPEILVGVVIAMIAAIVMLQVFSTAEGFKRSTTGGGDAQINGTIALHTLQRDIRQAGYATGLPSIVGCSLRLSPSVTLPVLAPVIINPQGVPAGDANTDTLLIAYGSAAQLPEGARIFNHVAGQATYTVATPGSFAVGDYAVPQAEARPQACVLAFSTVSSRDLPNSSVGLSIASSTSMKGGTLINLGAQTVIRAYAIRGGALTSCDYLLNDCGAQKNASNQNVWVPIASNVVSLRALYGRDTTTPLDRTIDAYDRTTPSTVCEWAGLGSLRLALVARNEQFEKTNVTTAAPSWAGAASAAIDLSQLPDWQRYRYRLFETTVPLMNMLMPDVPSGC